MARVMIAARQSVVASITQKWNITQPRTREKIQISRPRYEATTGAVKSWLFVEWRRGLNIADFGAREVASPFIGRYRGQLINRRVAGTRTAGNRRLVETRVRNPSSDLTPSVTARILKGGRQTVYRGNVFMARMKSGMIGVFRRVLRAGITRMSRDTRRGARLASRKWAIIPLHMVSFGTMVNNNKGHRIIEQAEQRILASWRKEFAHHLNYYATQRRAGRNLPSIEMVIGGN
jgi:hypothetical protein